MNESLFYRWIRKHSGISDATVVEALKQKYERVPGIDGVLDQGIREGQDFAWMEIMVQGAVLNNTLAPSHVAATTQSTRPSVWQITGGLLKKVMPKKKNKASPPNTATPKQRSPLNKKMVILIVGGVLVLAVLIGVLLMVGGDKATPYEVALPYPDVASVPEVIAEPVEAVEPAMEAAYEAPESPTTKTTDQVFWANLARADVPELSPGNLSGVLNAKTMVGVFLMIVLTFWAIGEGSVRKKGQSAPVFFTIVSIMAGWLTMPILIAISKTQVVGWVLLGAIVITFLWAISISAIKSQSDLSPTTVALAIFAASLFYVGKLAIIETIGALFGLSWAVWTRVTSLGGVLTLLVTGRGLEACLTILIFILGLLVIFLAGKEVGKNHGRWAPFVIGLAVIVVFLLANWGLNVGVNKLVNSQNLSVTMTVVLKVLAPILAWFVSLFASVGLGVLLGDVEVGQRENRQRLGLEKSGSYLQSIADFLILGTVIPLFLGVIMNI